MKTNGLARIVSQPEPREYLLAQFLGDEPATVPAILTADLRDKLTKHSAVSADTDRRNS